MEEQVTKSKNIVGCDGILPEAPLTTSTRKVIPSTRYRFGRKVIRIHLIVDILKRYIVENHIFGKKNVLSIQEVK